MGAGYRADMGACFDGGFEADRTRVLMIVLIIWKPVWERVLKPV